jgi:Uncharacterised protein family (UPF0175)
MSGFQVTLPEDLLALPGVERAALSHLAREALLVRLYDLGELSSSQAAALLGISRRAFLDLLGSYHVSALDDDIDVSDELQHALRARA